MTWNDSTKEAVSETRRDVLDQRIPDSRMLAEGLHHQNQGTRLKREQVQDVIY